MANKLPWMKHYADARKDLFVRSLQDRFGHFGYAAWFKLLEVLHEHGRGDSLLITCGQLASELVSKPPTVRQFLAICQSSGKITVEANGQQLKITVKNFNEKQRNKFRAGTHCANEGVRSAQEEGDGEGEGEKERLAGFPGIIKDLAFKLWDRRWTDAQLEAHQFPFGRDRGRRIVDLEPSRCQFYLNNLQLDSKTAAACRHRITLKAMETVRG